ncbi:MAG: GAF domain-containing sensor histidine kinase [Candidatus Zixiibacteriota bacterium]|nr:MAG: GAF domain-containing sensor histidine kinase [candidate division Zixibacteria bacterium]
MTGLKRAVDELSVLNNIAAAVNITMSEDDLSRIIVSHCARHLGAEQGAIFMLPDEVTDPQDFRTYVRASDSSKTGLPIHLDQQLTGWMIKNKTTLICNAPSQDKRFTGQDFEKQGISSVMAVPLLERGILIGMMAMFNKRESDGFQSEDGRFLAIVGAQAAAILEKARLFRREAQFVRELQDRRMQSLAQLVAGVAHEINNPVGAIASSTELLGRAIDKLKQSIRDKYGEASLESEELKKSLKVLEDAARVADSGCMRVSDIVRRLKSFAQLDQAELQTVDLHQLLKDCLAMLEPRLEKHITVKQQLADLPQIECNPAALNQVFFHVLLNAIEAIGDKGTIDLTTATEGSSVSIEIRDSGAGIADSALPRVFDPGFTTKGVGVGVGLGLPICFQIVQAHQGTITIDSPAEGGTRVSITLPTRQQNPNV